LDGSFRNSNTSKSDKINNVEPVTLLYLLPDHKAAGGIPVVGMWLSSKTSEAFYQLIQDSENLQDMWNEVKFKYYFCNAGHKEAPSIINSLLMLRIMHY
jgi:hypothetical protein